MLFHAKLCFIFLFQSKALVNNQNSAQKMLDGVSYLTEAVVNAGSQPTKMISAWVADKIAPSYWRPNNEIKVILSHKTILRHFNWYQICYGL